MHRDVKPGNVLIREDGVAKISDFGIARTHGDPALTQSGFLTGTPSYFSPELARGGDPGPGTDVWALGATLYAAVEGHSPYEQRSNPVAVLHDITQDQPPHPQRADFLEPALQRMMDRDPQLAVVDGRRRARAAPPRGRAQARGHPGQHVVGRCSGARARRRPRGTQHERHRSRPRPSPTPARRHAGSPHLPQPVDRPAKRPRRRGAARLVLVALALLLLLGGVAWFVSPAR